MFSHPVILPIDYQNLTGTTILIPDGEVLQYWYGNYCVVILYIHLYTSPEWVSS